MTASRAELAALRAVAARLGPLRQDVMFVGGMIRGLLISDAAAPAGRPTDDIDVVAEVDSRAQYYALSERLRALGFREDQREGAPLCRWLIDGLTVDVMPDGANVLGFSNRWYRSASKTATWQAIGPLPDDRIRVVDAPHFVATKLTSFRDRGGGDFYHHDMEDIVAVIDGRAELLAELDASPDAVRAYVATELDVLLTDEHFVEAVAGHLPGDTASQARHPLLVDRIRSLASSGRA